MEFNNTQNDSIELPIKQEIFLHLQNARKFGMDIGGSLVKIAYSSSFDCKTASLYEDESDLIYAVESSSKKVPTLNFIKFETKYIETALDFMVKNLTSSKEFNEGKSIKVTGGGAIKYKDLITQKLGVIVEKEDELKCLIKGCNFLMANVPNEVFTIDYESSKYEFQVIENDKVFPYLLINIGSGVSILKVESEENFSRVGGSTIGGGTLWGLGSLLTDARGFDEILELADKGDHHNIDMLVKDIYGGNYDALGLNNDIIASSLGKTTRSAMDTECTREEHLQKFKQEDLVRSILIMICYDITQLATLHAKLHNIKKVIFGGYFISKNVLTMKFLKHGISYWSQNQVDCLFLRHEGYLGAVGAFLKVTEESDHGKYSWYENYAHSSVFASVRPKKKIHSKFDCFELNREEIQLVSCPLLFESASYIPDLVDLTQDEEARHYWLECFQKTINTYENQCIKSNTNDESTIKRANEFKNSYLAKLKELKKSPFAYGMLTVRSLLDLREHCMSEFQFVDVYSNEKREENKIGLDLLKARCDYIDSLADERERWYEVYRGLIAGNVYDYGAQAFIQKQKLGQLDSFMQALDIVEDDLLLREDYKNLMSNLTDKKYKSICIFVDNSGFDVILGVLPLVIEFLKDPNINVILCSNSKPAINDITHCELIFVIKKACFLNETLNQAYNISKKLVLIETGSSSPCLDFSRVNIDLANEIVNKRVDLTIIEGMGRAIHTNFNAKFKCDCLKVAALKNQWLAERFGYKENGSKKFPVIFKFEQA